MMTEGDARSLWLGKCVFLHLAAFLCIIFALLFIFPVTPCFADEPTKADDTFSKATSEPVYIIPDQPDSPFKFGVAITPDRNFMTAGSMGIQFTPALFSPFNDDYRLTQHADVSTVVRIALDEFKLFSGLNHWIHDVEKKMHGYSRKLKLTGELNLNKNNTDPVDYIEKVNFTGEIFQADHVSPNHPNKIKSIISQFEVNKVTWNMGVHINSPQLSFKLGIGDAITIESSAGKDVKIGAMIKLAI